MFTLGESTFTTAKAAEFFEAIRAIGMEGKYQLPRREDVRQYVICGVFTHEEIESCGDQNLEIKAISDLLLKMDSENKDGQFGRKFVCKGRIAVLLNNFGTHGEARLFDPDGSILKDIGVKSEELENRVTEKQNFLEIMKKCFVRKFGKHREQYIVLLSHLIPCTIEGHECSKLLREYVERSNDYIIVSYDCGYHETSKKLALTNLTHEHIHIVKPRVRRGIVNRDIRDIESRSGIKRLESVDQQDEVETRGDQRVTGVSKRQSVREKKVYSKKMKRAVVKTAKMRSFDDVDDDDEAEAEAEPKLCNPARHKIRGKELKSVSVSRPVRDGKWKKRGGYNRQNSKTDRNKLWE